MNDLRRTLIAAWPLQAGLWAASASAQSASAPRAAPVPLTVFADVLGDDENKAVAAVTRIAENWHESSAALLIEMIHFVPSRRALKSVLALVEWASGRPVEGGVDIWYEWLWSVERSVHPDYAQFKARLYAPIDPRFAEYFEGRPATLIRLDEIRWGGVRRDGIPPLKNPKMIAARDATWLHADDIVFGVAINGDLRAYPKRILAWHEMFKDRIGGRDLAGVYCTQIGRAHV